MVHSLLAELDMTETQGRAHHYQICLDSVGVINNGREHWMKKKEWKMALVTNKEHLEVLLSRTFWTTENLQILRDAVTKATTEIASIDA